MERLYPVFAAYVFVTGLCVGSFLNVVIYRVPRKISVARGRSFCPNCKTVLAPRDLIPVLGRALQWGKCRHCGAPISFRYTAVELLTGILFSAAFLRFGFSAAALLHAPVLSCLIALAFIDWDEQIIPDRFPLVIALCGAAAGVLGTGPGWRERLIGAAAVSVPLLILALTTGGMGEGDVKLFAALGLYAGVWSVLLTFLIAAVTAAGYGGAQMLRGKADRKTAVPFGPFIALGAALAILFGEEWIRAYSALF